MFHLTKTMHVVRALASFARLVLRGVWTLRDSPQCVRRELTGF